MFYYIQTWWRWFWRCGLSRGFGVQSPSAYSFIRYVINEHYPYYAYDELKRKLPTLGRQQHKFGRLLLRLANYWQPEYRYSNITIYDRYLYAGCHKTNSDDLGNLVKSETKKLIVIDVRLFDFEYLIRSVLPLCNEHTLLVLLGLNKLHDKQLWNDLKASDYTGITYNLYYIGIVFFDKSVYKQHYNVNF